MLVDVASPFFDRISSGYEANQEDQVPDPFYLVAVGSTTKDYMEEINLVFGYMESQ